MEVIIPGLPNDIARQCLIRIPFSQIHSLRSVCKAWNNEIKQPEFFILRKSAGKAQPLVVLRAPVNNLVVFVPETGCWSKMPPLPNKNLAYSCEIVAVRTNLVVMGGYDEKTDCYNDSVFVFDFLSSTWGLGANMPDAKMDFGCASDGHRNVFVAGGTSEKQGASISRKKAVKSAWTYDVPSDKWNQLPDMARERQPCKGLFHHGKFHVIDKLQTSLEIFDVSSRVWSEESKWFTNYPSFSPTCVEGSDQKAYTYDTENYILVLKDDKFQRVAKPPHSFHIRSLTSSLGHLWLTSVTMFNVPLFYKLDLKELIFTILRIPVKYYGSHIECKGCLSI